MTHSPPDRLKHFFEFYGLTPESTPERANMLDKAGHGLVYIIQCRGFVKIGITKNDPMIRLGLLQVGNPYKLTLLNSFYSESAKYDEGRLHTRLARYYVRGEWYRIPKRLLSILVRMDSYSYVRSGKALYVA